MSKYLTEYLKNSQSIRPIVLEEAARSKAAGVVEVECL
jgi:hypothetical protein